MLLTSLVMSRGRLCVGLFHLHIPAHQPYDAKQGRWPIFGTVLLMKSNCHCLVINRSKWNMTA